MNRETNRKASPKMKFQVSTYAVVKREFGFKGNKAKVLAQLEEYIEKKKEEMS